MVGSEQWSASISRDRLNQLAALFILNGSNLQPIRYDMNDAKPAAETAPEFTVKELRKIDTQRQVCRIRYSPCGKFLFGGGYDATIKRWDMTGEETVELDPIGGHHGWIQSVAFVPDGETLISVDSWGQMIAWPYADKNPKPKWRNDKAHDGWIRDLAISRDGKQVATASRDRFVRVWSVADGKLIAELPRHEHDLTRLSWHPDGKSLVFGDLFGTVQHWDVPTKKLVREIKFEKMHYYERIQDVPGIYHLGFDIDADTLVCAGGQPTRTGNHQGIPILHLVDWKKLEVRKSLEFGTTTHGFIFDLAWLSHGFMAMVTSGNPGAGQFLVSRMDADKPFFSNTKMANCHTLAVHPDEKQIVVAATNRNHQGNGAVRDKEGNYVGNSSPMHVFEVTKPTDVATGSKGA